MITAIIQARTGSTRLPQKVLLPILGKPMLQHQIERLKHAKTIDTLIVATTDAAADDRVENLAQLLNVECFRGSENDVLDRYYKAAKNGGADIIVRITGDCPLHDPKIVDEVVMHFEKSGVDYLVQPQNYPEGFDTEICRFAALERAWKEAQLPSEREHVMPYIRNHPELFKVEKGWRVGKDDNSSIHGSVDTERDFLFVSTIYERLYKTDSIFTMRDVIDLLQREPALLEINNGGTGFEGLEKSLREDEEWKKAHGEE